ncbi:flagellar brake protein [Paenibacillus sp. 32O-W]|uniref:flagellar brake protein n=1 Tax=Paenibacillus sp. 32O-W TaxID=1695218 RepID=UPI0007851359|nr:PilZ domain-containing protein [Paenibacillus sp. 32O-W]
MLPKVNQIVYFRIISPDGEEALEEYKTRVADESADALFIELPLQGGSERFRPLRPGDELSVSYVTKEGVKYDFATTVLGFRDDAVRLVRIRKPSPDAITRIQRRSYLRVPAELELAVRRGNERFLTMTRDVSGGGISFVCESGRSVAEGDALDCWLLVPFRSGAIEHVHFRAEVARIEEGDARKRVMLKYAEITDSERQIVIRFCLERQVELHRKEKGLSG